MDVTDISIDTKSLNNKLARIEGWLQTYYLPPFDGSGGIGGPIATYWASSPYMIGPYIMNSYGTIRGLCERARYIQNDKGKDAITKRIMNHIEYYIRICDPTTGLFVCSWGEDPFNGLGLIQQSSAVTALWDVYQLCPDKEVFKTAQKGWEACVNHPRMTRLWNVNNQALRACESLIVKLKALNQNKPSINENKILERIIKQIHSEQISDPSFLNGALPQSLSDDRIILPYQGKCLSPLIEIAQFLNREDLLIIAKNLADFIMNLSDEINESLVSGVFPPKGRYLNLLRKIYRLRILLPFFEIKLRNLRRNSINDWIFYPYPRWISRSADTARGFWKLGKALGETKYIDKAKEILEAILRYQSPLGGVRNTFGFSGKKNGNHEFLCWQDATPIPRWNSYLIQFLHELLKDEPVLEPNEPSKAVKDEVSIRNGECLVENRDNLILFNKNKKIIWKIEKGKRWGKPFRDIRNWNERSAVKSL